MKTDVEVPQCPICQEPFVAGMKLVVVQRCGHALCKECSGKHFVTYRQKECPMCRTEAKRDDLVDLYLSYGEHSGEALAAARTSKDCDLKEVKGIEDVSNTEEILRNDKSSLKAQKVISSLKELIHSEPRTWKGATKPTEEDLGLRILRTGMLIREAAEKVKPVSSNTTDLLVKLGSAVSDLHIIVRKVIALAHDYESLQDKLSQYDNETKVKVAEYKKENNVLTRKISISTKEHREKETSLKQRLHKLQEELAVEKSARQTSTNVLLDKEEELAGLSKKFGLLQKKYLIHKQELETYRSKKDKVMRTSHDQDSDSSLVIDDQNARDEDHELGDNMHALLPWPSSSISLIQSTDSGFSRPKGRPSPQVLESCSPPSSPVSVPSGPSSNRYETKRPKPKSPAHTNLTRRRDTYAITAKSDKPSSTRTVAGSNPYTSLTANAYRSRSSIKPPSGSSASRILTMPMPARRDHRGEAPKKRTRPNLDEVDIG